MFALLGAIGSMLGIYLYTEKNGWNEKNLIIGGVIGTIISASIIFIFEYLLV